MIALVDKYNSSDYQNLTFPNLTEVTGFVIFYRVNGLTNIGKLFPNLRYIRGNELLNDYALVIYEMMHLKVSFLSLQRISHFLTHFGCAALISIGNKSNEIDENRSRRGEDREKSKFMFRRIDQLGSDNGKSLG